MDEHKTILIVDDDPTILEMLRDGLSEHGYAVIAVGNPSDALKAAENTSISYALIDLDLGWKYSNGIELGQELKAKYGDLLVIIMTGYHNIKFAVEAMRKHYFHYLIKPFRIDQILSLIERADYEKVLIQENQTLRATNQELIRENERLRNLLHELGVEESALSQAQRDHGRKKAISNTTALRSYQRHKEVIPSSEKKE